MDIDILQNQLRILFVKQVLAWPRSKGHDNLCFHMMRSLMTKGHVVGLATQYKPHPDGLDGLDLAGRWSVEEGLPVSESRHSLKFTRLQERFRSYWGIEREWIEGIGQVCSDFSADVVVAGGMNVLPFFGAVKNACRVWYANDELAWHHLSQIQLRDPATYSNVSSALLYGGYERIFSSLVDRIWVVSRADQRAMKLVAGKKDVDDLVTGVDHEYFSPSECEPEPGTCVFWGRLDFGPNVQAVEHFCKHIWPTIIRERPTAKFTVVGFNPTERIHQITSQLGVALTPNVPDLRDEVSKHAVVVMPIVSGWGIKTKLLEGAAMGRAIVASPRCRNGLRIGNEEPVRFVKRPQEWVEEILNLWGQPNLRKRLGANARRWVERNHSWDAASDQAINGLTRWIQKHQVSHPLT